MEENKKMKEEEVKAVQSVHSKVQKTKKFLEILKLFNIVTPDTTPQKLGLQIKMIVYGISGIGRYTQELEDIGKELVDFLVVAPTIQTAQGIDALTLENLFYLRYHGGWDEELTQENRKMLQNGPLSTCEYLILDNFEMIGSRLLHHIEERCRIAKYKDKDPKEMYFGGINVMVFADFAMLNPVND